MMTSGNFDGGNRQVSLITTIQLVLVERCVEEFTEDQITWEEHANRCLFYRV